MSLLPVERQMMDAARVSDEVLEGIIDGAFLVIGAFSDADQNNRIKDLCTAQGILFNNADGKPGDVIIPSVTGGKNYVLAISTKGSSPAVARFIREYLETQLPSLDEMVSFQSDLRAQLKQSEPSVSRRNAILRDVLHDPMVWKTLVRDISRARQYVQEKYLNE